MNPEPASVFLFYLPALLAGLFAAPLLWGTLSRNLNSAALGQQINKLLRAGNADRALKLASVLEDSPQCAALRSALVLARKGAPDAEGSSQQYRESGGLTPEQLRASLEGAFRATFEQKMRSLAVPRALAALGLLGGLLATGFALSQEDSTGPAIAAVAAALVAAWGLWGHRRLVVSRDLLFNLVAPELCALTLQGPSAANLGQSPFGVVGAPGIPRLTLDVLEPGEPPRTVQFARAVLKVGRDCGAEHLELRSHNVARLHAVFECTMEGVDLIDLGAGTKVNGETINKRRLGPGDRVEFGDVLVVLRTIE